MAFGPEFIRGVAAALNKKLPWRVSRVEGGDSWVALKVSYEDQWLLISWGAGSSGCCLAGSGEVAALREGSPARTPLAEALKSRVVRGDIVSARQINRDRVLELAIVRRVAAGTTIPYFLVIEATEPVGNFLALDGERRIEEAARHSAPDQNRYRTLLPGHAYVPPPIFEGPTPQELAELRFEDVQNLAGIGRPLTRLIQAHWEERDPAAWLAALQEADTDSGLPCQATAKGYLTRLNVSFPEAVALGDDALSAAGRGVLSPLLRRGRERRLHEIDAKLKRAAKAKERHRDGLLKQLRDCEAAEVFRQKGEAILAHISDIPPRAESVTLTDWTGETFAVTLDPKLSPSRNAERYFKKYRKAKGDPQKIQEGVAALDSAIRELMEQRDILEAIDGPEDFERAVKDLESWLAPDAGNEKNRAKGKKRAKESEPPYLVYEKEGLTILVGLSARGNRFVTFRQARPEDIWLHAHELPGSHVIIRGTSREELEGLRRSVLEFAAGLAAGHSKGRNSGSVLVDYTERRYVRPVPGTVALVTYVNPGTLRVAPKEDIS